MSITTIQPVTCYRTADGIDHQTMDAAILHDAKVKFFKWCSDNICVGGEWSARMVADEISDKFLVFDRAEFMNSIKMFIECESSLQDESWCSDQETAHDVLRRFLAGFGLEIPTTIGANTK